jgi:hypothetical protein
MIRSSGPIETDFQTSIALEACTPRLGLDRARVEIREPVADTRPKMEGQRWQRGFSEQSAHQTAVVTGPKGQETFTDKYGRVKVQFHSLGGVCP